MLSDTDSRVFGVAVGVFVAVRVVQGWRKRQAYIAEHGRTDPPEPIVWEGIVRVRYARAGERWDPISLDLYVTPTLVKVRSPPWQHIRGIGSEWLLPISEVTMMVDPDRVTLSHPDVLLELFNRRHQVEIVEALTRVGVRHVT